MSVEASVDARALAATEFVQQTNQQPSRILSVRARESTQVDALIHAARPGAVASKLLQQQQEQVIFILLQKKFALCPDMRCAARLSPAAGVCVGCGALCCPDCTSRCPKYGRTGHKMHRWCEPRCATHTNATLVNQQQAEKDSSLPNAPLGDLREEVKSEGPAGGDCKCLVLQDKGDIHTISLIAVEMLQTSDGNDRLIKVNGWLTAPAWQSCECSDVLFDVLRQLRSKIAPSASLYRNVGCFNDLRRKDCTTDVSKSDDKEWETETEDYLIDLERCFRESTQQIYSQQPRQPEWCYDLSTIEAALQDGSPRLLTRPAVRIKRNSSATEKTALYAAMSSRERVAARAGMLSTALS